MADDLMKYTENQAPFSESDSLFYNGAIDETRWCDLYPYQLLVVESNGGAYSVKQDWIYTLPITPISISQTTISSLAVSAALKGAFEQGGGKRFEDITLIGTTGVLPARATGEFLANTSLVGAAFGGVISTATSAFRSAVSVVSGSSAKGNTYVTPSDVPGGSTGYFQARLLQRFLDTYLDKKTTEEGKKLRLALCIWKDEAIYLVTPRGFETHKTAQSPHKKTFSLSLRAYKKISPNDLDYNVGPVTIPPIQARQANLIATVLDRMQSARRAIVGVSNTITAISSDIQRNVLEFARQGILAAKDAINVATTAVDFPSSIKKAYEATITEPLQQLTGALNTLNQEYNIQYSRSTSVNVRPMPATQVTIDHRVPVRLINELSAELAPPTQTKATGALGFVGGANTPKAGTAGTSGQTVDDTASTLDNPRYFPVVEKVQTSSMTLNPTVRQMMRTEQERVDALTRSNYEEMRNYIKSASNDYATAVGLGNATYSRIFEVKSQKVREPCDDDYIALHAMNELVACFNVLAAYKQTVQAPVMHPTEYLAGIAANSGITFKVPRSKFAVPVPYKFTIEEIAKMYLNDPDRWMEIATLNDLREPYIDEDGFTRSLLMNGVNNTVILESKDYLEKGQTIWIYSQGQLREKRHVIDIQSINDKYHIIYTDGTGDLDRFKVMDGAYLHSHIPHTLNSEMLMWVPSDAPYSFDPDNLKRVPGVDYYDQLTKVAGMDLLLDSRNSLIITPEGDCKVAFGLTNIIQAVRLALSTPRGGLKRHPNYGFGIKKGITHADITAQDIMVAVKGTFKDDPTFSGVTNINVILQGPVAKISMQLAVRGSDHLLPITFDMPMQ